MSCYTYQALPLEYLHHPFRRLWHIHRRWIKACSLSLVSLELKDIHSSTLTALYAAACEISTSISVSWIIIILLRITIYLSLNLYINIKAIDPGNKQSIDALLNMYSEVPCISCFVSL